MPPALRCPAVNPTASSAFAGSTKTLATLLCLVAAVSLCACASPKNDAASVTVSASAPSDPLAPEKVPLPAITPFDYQPALRHSYLEGYIIGYRYGGVGTVISNCGWSQTLSFRAGQRGVEDGQRAGLAAYRISMRFDTKVNPEFEADRKYFEDALNAEIWREKQGEEGRDRPPKRPVTNAGKEPVSPTTPGPSVAHP